MSIQALKKTQAQLALETHELAVTAMTRIEAHEAECNRREEARQRREEQFRHQYDSDMSEVKRGLEKVETRVSDLGMHMRALVYSVGGSVILGLAGLVVWLLAHGAPWSRPPVGL